MGLIFVITLLASAMIYFFGENFMIGFHKALALIGLNGSNTSHIFGNDTTTENGFIGTANLNDGDNRLFK